MFISNSKKFVFATAVILLIMGASFNVFAADYPTKPVQIIIPWGVGGGTDMLVRALLSFLPKYFSQPMVAVNKPGGGGTIGTTFALKAKPDGYTLCITGWGPFVTQPYLSKLQYTAKDYTPVMQLANFPRILCAYPTTPYNTMKEFMEYAKKNPEKIKAGIAAVGSTGHLAMVQIEQDFDVKFTQTPQGGGGPQKVALLGGHSDVAPLVSSEAASFIKSKQIKALGVMDNKRMAEFPDIPTCAEQGYAVDSYVGYHMVVRAGTPSERVKILHDAFKKCLDDKDFQTIAKKLDIRIEYEGGEQTKAKFEKFGKLYVDIIKKLGIEKK